METKKFGIIQLNRIGDVLQTYQIAKIFKKKYPTVKLSLIARKQFAQSVHFLLKDTFDSIHLLDFKNTFESSKELNDLQLSLNEFIKPINKETFDVLINLSFSKSSNYLVSLIDKKHLLGSYYDRQNQICVQDQWSQFIYSNVMGGANCPFNLNDIYKSIFGFNISQEDLTPIKKNIKSPILSIHPFASQDKKMWKATKWSEIIYKILKENSDLCINIIGSEADINSAEVLLQDPVLTSYNSRISNYVGKCSIQKTYEILDKSTHFVGHDSMVGHLAKIAGLPTLTIALGTVRPIETTPYGNKSFVMVPRTKCFPCFPDDECSYFQCHSDISYQATSEVILQFINKTEVEFDDLLKKTSTFHLDSIDLYESFFSTSGQFGLSGINPRLPSAKEIFSNFLRAAWSFKFNDIEDPQAYPPLTESSYQELYNLLPGIQHLFELSEFGKKYSKYTLMEVANKSPSIAKIKEFGLKIDEIDHLQTLLTKTHPLLIPVVRFFELVKANLIGENVIELSESSFTVYHDCGLICSILHELLEKTLAEYKINNSKFQTQSK